VEESMYGRGGSWTRSTHRLVSVQRIQNRTLLKRYQTEKEIITTKRSPDSLNEQYLFFGSRGTAPLVIAESSEGFMVEHGREDAFYGQGNYFALNARYSHYYAHRVGAGSEQHRQLLMASVLCGTSKEYAGGAIDRDMKRTALPSEYDSVQGGPHMPSRAGAGEDDSEMLVVYKSSQTMPEFLEGVRQQPEARSVDPSINMNSEYEEMKKDQQVKSRHLRHIHIPGGCRGCCDLAAL
jgi:hypothetical protein